MERTHDMAKGSEPEAPTRRFTEYLGMMERGGLNAELGGELKGLLDAIKATGKKGKLTLTLDIEPIGKGEVETVKVGTAIKVTAPDPARQPTIFFLDDELNLSRSDPRQSDIEDKLRSIPGGRDGGGRRDED